MSSEQAGKIDEESNLTQPTHYDLDNKEERSKSINSKKIQDRT